MDYLDCQIKKAEQVAAEEKAICEAEGREYIPSSSLPINSLEMFEDMAYVMHKHGDPSQPNDVVEWLEQFETFDVYKILPQLLEMWKNENHQESVPKKETEK